MLKGHSTIHANKFFIPKISYLSISVTEVNINNREHINSNVYSLFVKVNTGNANHAWVFLLLKSYSWKNRILMRQKIACLQWNSKPWYLSYVPSTLIITLREWDTSHINIRDTDSGGIDSLDVKVNTKKDNHAWSTAPIFNCWKVVLETMEFFMRETTAPIQWDLNLYDVKINHFEHYFVPSF